jgi:hypothetical protein
MLLQKVGAMRKWGLYRLKQVLLRRANKNSPVCFFEEAHAKTRSTRRERAVLSFFAVSQFACKSPIPCKDKKIQHVLGVNNSPVTNLKAMDYG